LTLPHWQEQVALADAYPQVTPLVVELPAEPPEEDAVVLRPPPLSPQELEETAARSNASVEAKRSLEESMGEA
jgi:hypothetical protein